MRIVCEPVGLDSVGLRKTTEGASFYWVEEAMRRIVLTIAAAGLALRTLGMRLAPSLLVELVHGIPTVTATGTGNRDPQYPGRP